jgi:hypothetical protein
MNNIGRSRAPSQVPPRKRFFEPTEWLERTLAGVVFKNPRSKNPRA